MAVSKRWDFIFKPWGRSPIPCRFLPKNLLALQCPCRRARARQRKGEMAVFPPLFCETKTGDGLVCSRFFFLSFIEIFVSVVTSNHHLILKTTHQKLRNVKHRFTAQLLWFSATVVDDLSDAMISGKKQLWNSHTIHVWYKYLATFGGFLWFSCR